MSDWNWNNEDCIQDVIVRRVDALAVYVNTSGDIVIRQQGSMGEDDNIVIVPVAQVEALITALQREIKAVDHK